MMILWKMECYESESSWPLPRSTQWRAVIGLSSYTEWTSFPIPPCAKKTEVWEIEDILKKRSWISMKKVPNCLLKVLDQTHGVIWLENYYYRCT